MSIMLWSVLNTSEIIQLSDVRYVINGCENKCTDSYQTEVTNQHMIHFKFHWYPMYMHYTMGCS
jgi:hypothetical protein